MGPPGPPRPRKSTISGRPKNHVLKTQVQTHCDNQNYVLETLLVIFGRMSHVTYIVHARSQAPTCMQDKGRLLLWSLLMAHCNAATATADTCNTLGPSVVLLRPCVLQNHPTATNWYREVSVDRSIATETQTLKLGRESRKVGREPKENDQKPQNPQKLRDPTPT